MKKIYSDGGFIFMKKYDVYATYSTSKFLGQFEAESEYAAIKLAENSEDFEYEIDLCWNCLDNAKCDDPSLTKIDALLVE